MHWNLDVFVVEVRMVLALDLTPVRCMPRRSQRLLEEGVLFIGFSSFTPWDPSVIHRV